MNWYDLVENDEWHYQVVDYPQTRYCPTCGAELVWYYGWLYPVEYPMIGG